jgi:hypothetical protein
MAFKRNRTADLLNAIQALSQLSYGPSSAAALGIAAGPPGTGETGPVTKTSQKPRAGACVRTKPLIYSRSPAARRNRTADLLNAIQALSQLSYGPSSAAALGIAAGRFRLAPPTLFIEG